MKLKDMILYTSRLSVLYVEDNKGLREQTVAFLQKVFGHVSFAVDGQDGIEKYKERDYDIVITDILMPNKDGIYMIQEIRKIDTNQNIVVTSGHDDAQYLLTLINLGVDRFHIKPFDRKEFLFSLYKTSKEILYEKEEKIKCENLGQIIDTVENGIIIVDNGEITHVNKATHKMTYTKSLEELRTKFNSLQNYLIKTDDYIFANNVTEIIEKTRDTSLNNMMLRLPSGITTFLFSCHTLGPNKYVISFSDVTAMDNKEMYNQLTTLPNEVYLATELENFLKTDDEKVLFAIVIKNYKGIKKWHGKSAGIEAEKKVATTLKYDFYGLNLNENGFLANIGTNRYVIICKAAHVTAIKESLNNIREHNMLKSDSTAQKMREISLELEYRGVTFSEATTNGVLNTINEEFKKIS